MEDIYEFSADVYKKLGDAILWTTILASVHKDGVIEEEERAEAIKQTHIRSFSTEAYIKPIYEHLDVHFEKDFDSYIKDLPEGYKAKEAFIQAKLADCLGILKDMGPVFTAEFSRDLESLFDRVFNANASLFQSFLFPFMTGHLEDKNKRK
ncbi:MAG: hypothetical protein HQ500_12095 [Flavobacteriales bacterium]|nr:hypothetical protein [Flavobacteriales bacterium]